MFYAYNPMDMFISVFHNTGNKHYKLKPLKDTLW